MWLPGEYTIHAIATDGFGCSAHDWTHFEIECDPMVELEKTVWREDGDGCWDDYTEVNVEDTVKFNISIYIPEDACPLYGGVLEDYLPDGLDYIGGSTSITMVLGDSSYHDSGTAYDPEEIPDTGYTTLRWGGEEGSNDDLLLPGTHMFLEFEALVTECGDYTNIANITSNYGCCNTIYAEDDADVLAICECLDIVDMAISYNPTEFNTLVEAVIAADLVTALKSTGPFTVFAPTDAAFGDLDPVVLQDLLEHNTETLAEILKFHVVPGLYMSTDLYDGQVLTTLQGSEVFISINGGVYVNEAQVIQPDIECCNGVIHVIDAVLLLPS